MITFLTLNEQARVHFVCMNLISNTHVRHGSTSLIVGLVVAAIVIVAVAYFVYQALIKF